MGCGDVRLLRTIGSVDFTGQERAALNKLTMPFSERGTAFPINLAIAIRQPAFPKAKKSRKPCSLSGVDFKEAVIGAVAAALLAAPRVPEPTGSMPGRRSRCKKGDAVIPLTDDSTFWRGGCCGGSEARRFESVSPSPSELDGAHASGAEVQASH